MRSDYTQWYTELPLWVAGKRSFPSTASAFKPGNVVATVNHPEQSREQCQAERKATPAVHRWVLTESFVIQSESGPIHLQQSVLFQLQTFSMSTSRLWLEAGLASMIHSNIGSERFLVYVSIAPSSEQHQAQLDN